MPDHYTTKQVAEKLGVTVQAVFLAIKEGRIKAVKYGRDWMISEKEFGELKGVDRGKINRIERV